MEMKKPDIGHILLDPNLTLVIPPYQRGYRWKSDRWQTLIQDIVKKVTSPEKKHWIGILLTAKSEDFQDHSSYLSKFTEVIDGQQRLVTLRIWLQALLDFAQDTNQQIIGDRTEFTSIYCQEADELELSQVINGNWRNSWKKYSQRNSGLLHCYTYFRWILWLGEDALLSAEPEVLPSPVMGENNQPIAIEIQWQRELDKRRSYVAGLEDDNDYLLQTSRSGIPNVNNLLRATLGGLSLVELLLERDRDEEPAEIFEALNGQRLELDQFDHVRNYFFSAIKSKDDRKNLYEQHWEPHELALSNSTEKYRGADTFLYDFLISKGETRYQKTFNRRRTASQFVRFFTTRTTGNQISVAREDLLPNLAAWISVKSNGESFAIGGDNVELDFYSRRRLRLMSSLSSGPLTPIIMNLVFRMRKGEIDQSSLQRQLFLLESFLGRQVLNRIALSPLRSQMMQLSGKLQSQFTEDQLKREIVPLMPDDEDIMTKLLPQQISQVMKYAETAKILDPSIKGSITPRQLLAIFQAIEEKRQGESRNDMLENDNLDDPLSIEHIYPQDPELWRDDIREWRQRDRMYEERLHTLGNLAVVPKRLNSKLSNKIFAKKREIMHDQERPVPAFRSNEMWLRQDQHKWTTDDIDERAKQLLRSALQHWIKPSLG